MAGYMSGLGQPGMRGQDSGSGWGLLARDTTALEENDRGWNNLPPWGYARNRPIDTAPPRSLRDYVPRSTALSGWLERVGPVSGWFERSGPVAGTPRVLVQSRGSVAGLGSCCTGCAGGRGCMSGLGDSNAAVSANAIEAANAFAEAILSSGLFGTSLDGLRMPDFARGNSFLAQVADTNLSEAIFGYANSGSNAIKYLLEYGNDEGVASDSVATAQMAVAGLKSIAAGQPVQQVAGDAWTDAAKSGELRAYQHKDDEDLSLLQKFAMSDAGAGVIHTGAFTAGVTGINKQAILEEGKRSDLNVAADIAAGEKVGSMGKYAIYIGAAVLAYLGAKKAGIV